MQRAQYFGFSVEAHKAQDTSLVMLVVGWVCNSAGWTDVQSEGMFGLRDD